MKVITQTATILLTMPGGDVVPVDVSYKAHYEKNPHDNDPERDDGEDDGWVITDLSLV